MQVGLVTLVLQFVHTAAAFRKHGGLCCAFSFAGKVSADVDKFLCSDDGTLLLVGEAGSGKSMFSRWYTDKQLQNLRRSLVPPMAGEAPLVGTQPLDLSTTSPEATTLWVPFLVELKAFSSSDMKDVLPR